MLFVRRSDTGFGRALSAIAQAIDAGVQPTEAILKIVGIGLETGAKNRNGFHEFSPNRLERIKRNSEIRIGNQPLAVVPPSPKRTCFQKAVEGMPMTRTS